MRSTRARGIGMSHIVICATAVALSACGGSSEPTPPPTPSITMTLAPTSTTIAAGASGSVTLSITRNGGFADVVNLTASGAPAGMTITLGSPTLAPASTSTTVNVSVGAAVAAGTYGITIAGAGTGITTATQTLPVIVTAPTSTSVSIAWCAADAPLWVAMQDGSGAWTRLTPSSGSTYAFTLTSGRGAFASVDSIGAGFQLNVFYASATELRDYAAVINTSRCGSKSVTGTTAGQATTDVANVSLGAAFQTVVGNRGFTINTVAEGAQDLVAVRTPATTRRALRMILRRGITIAAGGAIPVLDFGAAESFAPSTANVTITGLGASDTAFVTTAFAGVRGSTFGFLSTRLDYRSTSGAVPYEAVPAANLNTGELNQLYTSANTGGTPTSTRYAFEYVRAATDRTIALGAELTVPTVTKVATTPYARMRTQLATQAEYARYLTSSYTQASLNRTTFVTVTGAYTGGTAWDVTVPDFSALAGWSNTWGLQNGTPITWMITGQGGANYYFDTALADGQTSRAASRSSVTAIP
jgi:hypothetical protein